MKSKPSTPLVYCAIVTALLATGPGLKGQNLTNNLIFYTPFSSSFNDIQGGRTATVGGAASRQTSGGVAGGYLQLQNSSGGKAEQWVYYPDPTPATNDFSVQVWVRSSDPQNGQAQPDFPIVANKDWGSGANVGWVAAREDGALDGDKFQWNMNSQGGSRIDLDPYGNANATVFDGTWHQLLISYQRDGYATFYRDGAPVLFADISAQKGLSLRPIPDATWVTNNILALGQDATLRYWHASGNNVSSYNGDLDEVALWGHALNPSEAFTAYAKGTNGQALSSPLTPRIIRQPLGGTRYAGGNFRLFSIVGGDPVTFQWYRDSAPVVGATNADVLLTNLSTNNTGSYRLVVNSGSGSMTSSPAVLAVLPADSITNGLAVYLNLDDNVNAQAGTAVNGTPVGGAGNPPTPKYTPGRIGNAAIFDNNGDPGWMPYTPTDWGISLGDLEGIYSNSFSFSLWINETNNNNDLALFGNKDWTVGGNIGWVVAPYNTALVNYYAEGGPRRDIGGVNILDSQWHHLAGVFDRDANAVYVYVDGNRMSSASLSGSGWESFAPTNFGYHATLIGGSGDGAYSGAGSVDDVGIWRRLLSPGEILSIYSQGLANQPLTTATAGARIPPTLSTQPQSLTVFEGRKASFAVTAAGSPPLSYRWFKDNNPILNATNTTLVFNPVSTNDQGSYTVVVTNSAGAVTSAPPAILTVLRVTNITSGLAVYLNFDNNISAQAGTTNNGAPVGAVAVEKYEAGIIGSAARFDNDNSDLPPPSDWAVSLGDVEWIYDTSWSFSIWVKTSDTYGTLLGNKDWYSGNNVGWCISEYYTDWLNYRPAGAARYDIGRFNWADTNWHQVSAVFDRDANAVYTYVDGALTTNAPLGPPGLESLTPAAIRTTLVGSSGNGTESAFGDVDDLGIWCRPLSAEEVLAIYLAGLNSRPLTSAVVGATKPLITSQPQSVTVLEGFPVSFKVTATGTAPLAYQWRRNGANLSAATENVFNIPAVTAGDAGSYVVVISNFVGAATSNPPAVLTVNLNPGLSAITNGLVVYLNFESNILAQGGTTVSGTPIGVIGVERYESGIVGATSARFDNDNADLYRASDWAVSLGDIEWVYTNDFSFSIWVKTTDTYGALLGNKDWLHGYNIGWCISEFFTDWLNYNAVSSVRHDIGNFNWSDDYWHHVAAVFYRGINTVYTYVDGKLTAQDSLGVTGTESLTPVSINTTLVGSSGNAIESAYGNVDDLGMWTRPLTQAELVGIYQAGVQGRGVPQAILGAPPLRAVASAGSVSLVYPGWARGYTLESTTSLAPTAWSPISATPAIVGGNSVVNLPVTSGAQFYRLRH